jgi:uncharacterized protein (DUF697 family)
MKLFTHKSKWDRAREAAVAAISKGDFRQAGKVTLSIVGGAVAATVASAAISSVRQQDEK